MKRRNTDRISMLPDELLVLVVSFLTFKEAARTSVLSKRWRSTWLETENIFLDDESFVKSGASNLENDKQRTNFISFANGFMNSAKSLQSVKYFRLKFSKPAEFSNEVGRYVSIVGSNDLKLLSLDFSSRSTNIDDDPTYVLPDNVYQNRNLESLQFIFCKIDFSQVANFISLQTLFLQFIELNSSALSSVLINCPNLVTLSLKKCWGLEGIAISAAGRNKLPLRNLIINESASDKHAIKIYAPNLTFLKFVGVLGVIEFDGNHDRIIEAEFDYTFEEEVHETYGDFIFGCLQSIYSVRVLTVCSYILQVLPTGIEGRFNPALRVEKLVLNTDLHESVFLGIPFMLKSCPFLKVLVIRICPTLKLYHDHLIEEIDSTTFWIKDARALKCISSTLHTVNVLGFKATDNEFQFLIYLIRHGRVMENLNIEIANDGLQNAERYTLRAELLRSVKRASPRLTIRLFLQQKTT